MSENYTEESKKKSEDIDTDDELIDIIVDNKFPYENNTNKENKKENNSILNNKLKELCKKEKFKQIENLDNDQPWNYKILLFLGKMGKKTMGYRWMHEQEAHHNEIMAYRIGIYEMIILAILGTLTTGEFIGFMIDLDLKSNKITFLIITSLQLLFLCLAGIIKGYKEVSSFDLYQNKHNYAASKFAEINLSIQNQLSLNLKDRENDKEFMKNIIKQFNDILFLSPKISDNIKKKYLEEADENSVFNPLINETNIYNNNKMPISKTEEQIKLTNDVNLKCKYEIERWLQHF